MVLETHFCLCAADCNIRIGKSVRRAVAWTWSLVIAESSKETISKCVQCALSFDDLSKMRLLNLVGLLLFKQNVTDTPMKRSSLNQEMES